jgi:hypothetical protein
MEVATLGIPSTKLAVYTDSHGYIKLLAPNDWTCSAEFGQDGSGGVAVYPPGEFAPHSGFEPNGLAPDSSTEAIVASETGACQGCEVDQACRLFSSAKAASVQYGGCLRRAAAEAVDQIRPGVVAFQDPPGVTGDADPSGGRYPANGVMTYHPGSYSGSWLDTCTLPSAEHTLCTASLNTFVSWYGTE